MGKKIVNQVLEAQRVPGRINPRRNTLRHIVIKLMKKRQITAIASHYGNMINLTI